MRNPRSTTVLVVDRRSGLSEVGGRQIVDRSLEVRVIEHVEEVAFNLQGRSFIDLKALRKTEIGVEERRPNQRVADHFAVVAPRSTVCCTGYTRFIGRRRSIERSPI